METFKQFVESTNDFIGYHNTQAKTASRIRASGFKLQKKAKRKRLYGNGIYFTNEPNDRWGPEAIRVRLKPKNPLVDMGGELSYEGNRLGDAVEAIGKNLYKTFHMSDSAKRALAIEKYLEDNNIDMLVTDEMGKTIYVVRDDKIITII
jgi:hypothetical protein